MMPSEMKSEREWGTTTQLSGDGHSGRGAAGAEALGWELAAATWRRPMQWEGQCGHGGRGVRSDPLKLYSRGFEQRKDDLIHFFFLFHVCNLMIFCRVCSHHKSNLRMLSSLQQETLSPLALTFWFYVENRWKARSGQIRGGRGSVQETIKVEAGQKGPLRNQG